MSITPDNATVTTNGTVAPYNYTNYAIAIYQAGFNVLPLKPNSKAPALPTWKEYATRRQTEEEVRGWSWSQNIAIVNGINNIRDIDLDGCNSADVLFSVLQLLGL